MVLIILFIFIFIFFSNFKIFNSYMRSQTWTPLPPPSPQHLSGSSPCTSPKHAAPYVRHGLAILGIPGYLTCLLRNLYPDQETTVRTGHMKTDWFKIGKGVQQGCILSPCLFNLYAEYIMQNAKLDESQAGIKIASRNINNLRHTDDTTLMAENEEELKNHLIRVKEENKKLSWNSTPKKLRASFVV